MKNLTLDQMVIAAIGLKRHEMRHGNAPADLEALVPEILPAVPRDFMDGQPLRYQVHSDGSQCIYSVGEDGKDDRGSPLPQVDVRQPFSAWSGRDWVWPVCRPDPLETESKGH